MQFSFEQSAAYFTTRLGMLKGITRDKIMAKCPFHGDGTESLSVDVLHGLWKCHAGCGQGGLIDFEKTMFPMDTMDQHWDNIERLAGIKREKRSSNPERGKLLATYEYTDTSNKVVFQKLRYENKDFVQRAPEGQKWVYTLAGVKKVLYHLPEVVRASVVFISEGEKDADNVRSIDFSKIDKFNSPQFVYASTCNFDGAGKWKDEYSPYLAGKWVILMEDNDDNGRSHCQQVAESVSKYAAAVKIVKFPELPVKGDVSDFLEANGPEALAERITKTPTWKPAEVPTEAKTETPFFVPPSQMNPGGADSTDWLIPGVIHAGGKGLIVASPKAGKSMAALDLVVALASQQSWLGLKGCGRKIRSGVVSREDGAEMAHKRLVEFAAGRNTPMSLLEDYLRFNTYKQRSKFSLQSDEDVEDIIKWIKNDGIEFCIFDVLNVLHSADENSNTEMTKVMKVFDTIRLESGSQVTVIHHTSSSVVPGTKRPRGAGAIDSWWDWKMSIAPTAENEAVKDVHFSTKAGKPHPPFQIVFQDFGDGAMRILPAGL